MRVLLDTGALVWFAVNDSRLTERARGVLESFEVQAFVSAASAWEIATKARLGKWPDARAIAADLPTVIRELGFAELSVSVNHAQRAGWLPGTHKDPFDRMLIAQAQAEDLPIVSNDRIFDEYYLRRIW